MECVLLICLNYFKTTSFAINKTDLVKWQELNNLIQLLYKKELRIITTWIRNLQCSIGN